MLRIRLPIVIDVHVEEHDQQKAFDALLSGLSGYMRVLLDSQVTIEQRIDYLCIEFFPELATVYLAEPLE
jgi:hypothetical protein